MLDSLASNFDDLGHLADEYRLSYAERPKQQWFKLHSEVVSDLDLLATRSDNAMTPIIKSNTMLVRDMFEDMVKRNVSNSAIQEMVTSQFALRLRTIITNLAAWRTEIRQRGQADELLLIRLSIANVACWLTFILFNSYLLRSRVIIPISLLQQSAHIIGEGHLEHRVGLKANDEIGDLARSIDAMTQQLQRITTSRDSLEQEIQQRLQAEAELAGQHQHLLELVETSEAANRAKSIFLANMSHELRTPLNAILGFSELIAMDDTISSKHKENLDIINRSGKHLLSMINDVLDISKIEAGRLELDIQAFDLLKLLRDISDMVKVRATNKRLRFSLEVSPDVPQYIKTDSSKLRQILINLLGNAIKFTAQGQIILRVQVLPLSTAETVMLDVEVIDSGSGIPEDKLKELFKPFLIS